MSNSKQTGNTWETEIGDDGAFNRELTEFRHTITPDGPFTAEKGRYHLYVSYACPWAHRTLMVRSLKGLQDIISVDVVAPFLPDTGWSFKTDEAGATGDRVNQFDHLQEVYFKANKDFKGVITVPVLWDKKLKTIVNNESAEIIRLLNTGFQEFAENPQLDLYPQHLRTEIDELNTWIYRDINNGVYRCGFARTQAAYKKAFNILFPALDKVESILNKTKYLTGDQLTEADVRLFTTLVRFDAVYYTHFKCNAKRIVDYPSIWRFVRDIYNEKGVSETVNMDHIKKHYFQSHTHINPFGIIPEGPEIDFSL
ncbi:glutathione-dependent reductase [Vibrio breoganii]|uniref:Glutathione-dependent reductase n=1 Tax=Vibrio breoganii TaxID=553239 RepID=A0AAN1CU28_9VIBR|nr:glutathione S-transferase family protein [Vibrio breoganii]ANO35092.1 glutathione-dependent reductase [Vibrio breoganii]PMG83344.1 glutathione-dependent reductase [Vibrio breoganii]PMK48781.1 glutathione-dependent reductase [Vibrio breoganii]PMO27881.1 glutathione-dependent reductase [Vibrio breoganii]PMO52412.1 glutathione-dependent reductase [Vibrio breoganii]